MKLRSFFKSFSHAFNGIGFAIYSQRNMKIHIVISVFVIGFGFYFGISTSEWLLLMSAIFLVLVTEVMNTAIEILVDLVTKKKRYRAMLSKDLAAGAVLLSAFYALIIGMVIFGDKFLCVLKG